MSAAVAVLYRYMYLERRLRGANFVTQPKPMGVCRVLHAVKVVIQKLGYRLPATGYLRIEDPSTAVVMTGRIDKCELDPNYESRQRRNKCCQRLFSLSIW